MAKPMPARKPMKSIKPVAKPKPAGNIAKMRRTAPEDIENLDDDVVEVSDSYSGPDNSWSLSAQEKRKPIGNPTKPTELAPISAAIKKLGAERRGELPVEADDLIHRHGMTQTQIDNLKKRRNQYLADNVDLTMAPALMQIGAAAFNEAARLFLGEVQEWHEQGPDKQAAWINIAIAAIGAHCALPFKSLMNAPQNGEILIYIDGGWHPASYSKGTGNKPIWLMKSGYMIPANGKETAAYIYMDMPPRPSFAPHFDYIAKNYDRSKDEPGERERPSKITREIRSAAPAAIAGSTRDGAPRKADYYPPGAATKRNIELAKGEIKKLGAAKPMGKARPVKLR